MNCSQFTDLLARVVGEAGLPGFRGEIEEEIGVGGMTRRFQFSLGYYGRSDLEPFHVSCSVSWKWDALQSARTRSTEEDLLYELLGREAASDAESEIPWLRVDVELRATLPLGGSIPMPNRKVWERFVGEVLSEVEPYLSVDRFDGYYDCPSFWCGNPIGKFELSDEGDPLLSGVYLESWQGFLLPRIWDHPDRTPDPDPGPEVRAFADELGLAMRAWSDCVKILRVGEVAPS